jgi:hypothetical protein
MGTSASENIALDISATSNTAALQGARDDVTSLGKAAKEATDEMAEGYTQASASVDRFAVSLQHSEEGIERSRGAARGLALEVAHLSDAVVLSGGSMLGLVRAAGLAATEMAELSGVASLAASASGIGAIITVAATVIGLFVEMNREEDKLASSTKGLMDSLSGLASKSVDAIAAQEAFEMNLFKRTNQQIKDNNDLIASQQKIIDAGNGSSLTPDDTRKFTAAQEQNKRLLAFRSELEQRLYDIHKMGLDAQARADEQADEKAQRDQERRAADAHRIEEQREQKATALGAAMMEERSSALDKVNLSEEGQAIAKIDRETARREEEIRALQRSEDEETALIVLAETDRDAKVSAIRKAAQDAADKEKERQRQEDQRKQDEATQRQIHALESVMDAAIRSSDSYMQVVTKTLLTPIEKELEAEAAKAFVKAQASFASHDYIGAAEWGAVGLAAIEGARLVSQLGGLGSSGGGDGGAGAGSGASLTPRDSQGGGVTVLNLYTSDPFNRQNIMTASYELNRAGILNRPVYLPPTKGLSTSPG